MSWNLKEVGGKISVIQKPNISQFYVDESDHRRERSMLKEVLSRTNILASYHRVVSNKGVSGVDGMGVDALHAHVKAHWVSIRYKIETSTYIPRAVRKVEIPKPNGGVRMLDIPTVTDRLIQQSIAQVLSHH